MQRCPCQSTCEQSSPRARSASVWPLALLAYCLWIAGSASVSAGVVTSFADITHWTGTGANQAALVIDWADGRQALVWGYRFQTASSADMLRAIVEADQRLYAKVEQFSFGQFVHGLGYDRNANGFTISSGANFGTSGFVFSGQRSGAVANDPNDSYAETDAPFAMTWGLWTGQGHGYPGSSWQEAQVGISDRSLTNQAWDGFRFNSPGVRPGTAFAAVPEPTSWAGLLSCSLVGLTCRRSRGRRWELR